MVTIYLKEESLMKHLGIYEFDQLSDFLFRLKSEVKKAGEGRLEIEINADRLDMLHSGGIKRAVDGLMGRIVGEASYETSNSSWKMVIGDVPQRPFAFGCIINNLSLDDESLKELIQFQEKLHTTIGRKRRKVAIGIHDLSKIDSGVREITYRNIPLQEKFIPLGQNREMSVKDVLETLEQGKAYGHLALYDERIPAIMSGDNILSIPPVINSERTRLTIDTKSVFVDVTGTSYEAVLQTLNIISTDLAEVGGRISQIQVKGIPVNNPIEEKEERLYPDFSDKKKIIVQPEHVARSIGMELNSQSIVEYLAKMRVGAESLGDIVNVKIPPYRPDIMTQRDVVEDISMAIGYDKLVPNDVNMPRGRSELKPSERLTRSLRELSIGAGFLELFTFVMTSDSSLRGSYVKILNPRSEMFNAVRNSIIPNLLNVLAQNQSVTMPVRLFEEGFVVKPCTSDVGYCNIPYIAFAIMDNEVSFEQLQAPVHSILKVLGVEPQYRRVQDSSIALYTIQSRTAQILVDNLSIGIIGELKIEELEKFGLQYPVVVAEIDEEKLLRVLKRE